MKVAAVYKRSFSPTPVLLVPESPDEDAFNSMVTVHSCQRPFVEIRSLVLVLGLYVELCDPDRQACLCYCVQALLKWAK